MMALIDDLNAKLDAISVTVDNIAADEVVLQKEITDLQAQIAAGSPVTNAQLQSLLDKATAVGNKLNAIDASVPGGPAVP